MPLAARFTLIPPPFLPLTQAFASLATSTLLLHVPCLVTTKPLRLLQLRLSVRHLQQQASAAAGRPLNASSSADVPVAQAGLFAQLLLAHLPSLACDQARRNLLLLLQQLLDLAAMASSTSSGGSPPSPADRQQWADSVATLLEQHSTHGLLRSLVRPLLVPCASSLLDSLATACVASSTTPLPGSGGGGARALMASHGRTWLLLGVLRLHLASPPRGIDPAGKYLLAARHLRRSVAAHVDVEAAVRRGMRLLPGGHDESPQLAELAAERSEAVAALAVAAARVVPRPEPSQYSALASDVAGFVGSLGG